MRVATLAHRLAVRGRAHCPDRREPLSGLRIHLLGQYARDYREAAQARFGLGDYPAVLALAQGSGAEAAGLRPGDWIIAVNGRDMRLDPATPARVALEQAELAIATALAAGPAQFRVRREGADEAILLAAEEGCASRVELVPGRRLNASADGRIVQISTAVLAEAEDDDELAFIIAHEMAHNILRHAARLERTGRSRGAIRETEIEADRLAIRLLAAAGFDPRAAARFWQRFGRKTGAGIFSDGTHLRTGPRVRLLTDEADAVARAAQ